MRRQPSKLVGVVRQRIRELRLERGLTQEELCERAGISVDAISRIEGGTRVPTIITLEHIATALGVSPVVFFEGAAATPEPPRPASLRRVVTLLERHPESVLVLAEDAVTAVVRAYRSGGTKPRVRRRRGA
jgi:transcriptional regulator with XRE-family HTH domain